MDIEQLQDEILQQHGSGLDSGFDAGYAAGYKAAMRRIMRQTLVDQVRSIELAHNTKGAYFALCLDDLHLEAGEAASEAQIKFAGRLSAKRDFISEQGL